MRRGTTSASKDSFCFPQRFFFLGLVLECGEHQLLWRNHCCISKCQLRQDAQRSSSCTYLFVGSFVSVHLHHPLTEDVKRVFLVLLPFSAQPLPFGGRTPKEQNGELATPVPRPGHQDIGNGLSNQNGQKYVAAKERESADVILTGTGHSPVQVFRSLDYSRRSLAPDRYQT